MGRVCVCVCVCVCVPWYALLSILILPINSVINPVLYDDTMGRVIRRVCLFIQFYTRVVSQTLRTHFRIDLARKPGHTAASIALDVAGEPGQENNFFFITLFTI